MRATEDRKADHVWVLVARGGDDLLVGQSNAGVDHFHSSIATCDRNLLSTVAVAIEPRFGDKEARWSARNRADKLGDCCQLARASADCGSDASWPAVLTEYITQGPSPLASCATCLGQRD